MGNFRVVIDSVGGHGCDRTAKEGDAITPCGQEFCPDCRARELVAKYVIGWPATKATLTHWPGEPSEVVDDLVAGKRIKGSF